MRRVTLTQYLIEQQRHYGKVSPELRLLIEVIARACKAISLVGPKQSLKLSITPCLDGREFRYSPYLAFLGTGVASQ